MTTRTPISICLATMLLLAACRSSGRVYHDTDMDFGSIRTVAVMPFSNLTREAAAADRVREVFSSALLATGGIYVLPPGEVARGIARAGVALPTSPSVEEVVKLGSVLKADAVVVGVVKEYGEVRSGTTASNVVSISAQLLETSTGKVVWSGQSTKGGVTLSDRLLGSGGEPVNRITEEAVDELLSQLFH
ncbi:lipoprotein, putative [Anaeromyxobacter dehalogenans 2CP-1]|uniref:Lipoprotein, putative n=1 Tax=Anaeromyxobacter dehalogenans (strain ATCC BAA-258 / DSM 21875 / 2CP-1) TaxID=455488 RepID=B8JGW1_ANAD2|nr:GNA1162 family protein [Anaeromyxobacter dehalogenans]ACL66598.1 lipoprotein, putative [Anaeromyxobacter dehalogenans 2CP-1]